jgi:RimJ/RimL family protein N-acetyltransferase
VSRPDGGYYWQGPRLRLRALTRADLDIWLAEDTDTEAVGNLAYGVELPKSPAAADAFAAQFGDFNNTHQRVMFTIETLDGEVVGGINIHTMDQKNGTFSTGERIYRAHRGKGYAAEAKEIVLRYAFHELRYQKYHVACIETNAAQIRALTKFGCREEGRRRRMIYTGGQYFDELLFGMTKEEFEEKHPGA